MQLPYLADAVQLSFHLLGVMQRRHFVEVAAAILAYQAQLHPSVEVREGCPPPPPCGEPDCKDCLGRNPFLQRGAREVLRWP